MFSFDKPFRMYNISIKPTALKELEKVPKAYAIKIRNSIDKLAQDPRPPGVKKLKGTDENLYRVRFGDYRIIYSVEDEIQIIEVTRIGHRKYIYK